MTWNIEPVEGEAYKGRQWGYCELDDMIAALTALRGSEAHRKHVARWTQ
jgi:hypothetical protein